MLGTGDATKTDEFSEKFQGGRVIFNPKIYVADFGSLNRAFRKKLQHDFLKMRGGAGSKAQLYILKLHTFCDCEMGCWRLS